MAERKIELTVISATDLKKVVKFGKQTCYAVAYIDPEHTKKTKKDEDGGTDPTWNQKLELQCDEQKLLEGGMVITVEMYSDGTFSDKLIGTVTIPISDIAKEAQGKEDKDAEEKEEKVKEQESQEAQYLAFEVHRTSGKAKGVLNVAVKLGEKKTFKVYQKQPPQEPEAYGAYEQRDGPQSSFEPKVPYQTGYPAPPPPAYPNQYPPHPYGGVPPPYGAPFPQYGAPPPYYGNQYPPQQMPFYPQQPAPYYPQQPPPYYQQQGGGGSGLSAGGGMALGLGAGLVGGAVGGLLIADMVDDLGDDCDGGDF